MYYKGKRVNFKIIKTALVGLVLSVSGFANATLISYEITVDGTWKDWGTPFKMELSPVVKGVIVVDNNLLDYRAIHSFSLATGDKTWTLQNILSGKALVSFVAGELDYLNIPSASDPSGFIFFESGGSFTVGQHYRASDLTPQHNQCSNCVSFKKLVTSVPEPTTLAIFAFGMIGLASRRFKKQS
jgi:hypothetical protein